MKEVLKKTLVSKEARSKKNLEKILMKETGLILLPWLDM